MKKIPIYYVFSPLLLFALFGCALLEYSPDSAFDNSDLHGRQLAGASASPYYGDLEQSEEQKLFRERITEAINYQDLILGMNMDEVRAAWGEPREVEMAGDPRQGNHRWLYFNGLSLLGRKIVYFENGRVAGWDTSDR